jgi:hypothetical protein
MRRDITVRVNCNLPWMETWLCGLLAVLLVWKGILPGWRTLHTDFPNYYLVARLLREGYSLDRVYDWIWLQRIKDHWGLDQPLVGFAGLTPFSALPILPLSIFSALTAKRLWIAFNLLLLGASGEVLHRTSTLPRRRVWLLCLLCAFPLRTSFLLGQMHLLVLALLVFAYAFNRNQQHFACGACLSIAAMLKIYPFLFVVYFLWKRQWAALLAMCCAAILLLAAGTWVLGPGIVHSYAMEVLPRSLAGEILDPYSAKSGSMAALMHRLFLYEAQLNAAPLCNSPLLYSVLYPVWQVAVLAPLFLFMGPEQRNCTQLEWAAWIFALLLLSPVPASYHFVVMVLPMVLLADFLLKEQRFSLLGIAVGLYCLMSLGEFLPLRIPFFRLWIAIAFYVLLLSCLRNMRARRRTGLVYAFALVFCVAGAFSCYRHFDQLQQETQRRLLHVPPAYLATALRQSAEGYVFTAMQAEKYAVVDETGRAVAQGSFVEAAGPGESKLIAAPVGGPARVILQDAELPAISPDGMKVAFVRETKGRGSLWMATLQSPMGLLGGAPSQLTNDSYDVRNFALAPSGWIVFAAKVAGHTSLFSLKPGDSPTTLLPNPADTDFPAVSPDEQRVAFTRRIHNRWQLEYLDRQSGKRQTLTRGDCNVYSPQWVDARRIMYASDCGRGLGLTALASVPVEVATSR